MTANPQRACRGKKRVRYDIWREHLFGFKTPWDSISPLKIRRQRSVSCITPAVLLGRRVTQVQYWLVEAGLAAECQNAKKSASSEILKHLVWDFSNPVWFIIIYSQLIVLLNWAPSQFFFFNHKDCIAFHHKGLLFFHSWLIIIALLRMSVKNQQWGGLSHVIRGERQTSTYFQSAGVDRALRRQGNNLSPQCCFSLFDQRASSFISQLALPINTFLHSPDWK